MIQFYFVESTLKEVETRFWYKLPDDLFSILTKMGFTLGDIFVIVCLFRYTKADEHISEISIKGIEKYTGLSRRSIFSSLSYLKENDFLVKMGRELWDIEGLIKMIVQYRGHK